MRWYAKTIGLSVMATGLLASLACATPVASGPTLLDMTGVWARERVSHGPDHFDPRVLKAEEQAPPLTDKYMKIWRTNLERSYRGDLSYDSSAHCLPKGFPRVMMAPYGMEILATSGQINFFNEASQETVRVYLDGREELAGHEPTYMGFSNGRWQHGVLTIETKNMRADTIFDVSGIPHSGAMSVVQRMSFVDKDTLQDVFTISDPVAFKRDWKVTMVYRRLPASRYADEAPCHENNVQVFQGK